MGMRILFLLSISWIMGMKTVLFTLPWWNLPITGKSLVLIGGGLFLVYKATGEIHEKMEHEPDPDLPATGCRKPAGESDDDDTAAQAEMSAASIAAQAKPGKPKKPLTFGKALVQILLLDLVFSIDSVVTAVGMATQQWVMIGAVMISVVIMMASSGVIVRVIDRHPTIKMLALSFLLLIGVTLIAEGFGAHVAKGYIYFSMGFSLFVEFLNLRAGKRKPA
jgi:predicted tellurium resistance membrane protein TerC